MNGRRQGGIKEERMEGVKESGEIVKCGREEREMEKGLGLREVRVWGRFRLCRGSRREYEPNF